MLGYMPYGYYDRNKNAISVTILVYSNKVNAMMNEEHGMSRAATWTRMGCNRKSHHAF